MAVFQLVGIAFVTAIAALILKSARPELAFAVTVVFMLAFYRSTKRSPAVI